jgi:hypothetical protein
MSLKSYSIARFAASRTLPVCRMSLRIRCKCGALVVAVARPSYIVSNAAINSIASHKFWIRTFSLLLCWLSS